MDTPSAAKIATTKAACIGSANVLTPEGDGSAHPSGPIPCVKTGSASGTSFLLKNERDDVVG